MGVVPFYTLSVSAERAIGLDFADDLPSGDPLASCTCTARKYSDGTSVTSTLLADGTSCTILSGSSVANIFLKGLGMTLGLYEVVFAPRTASGQKLNDAIARVMIDN